MGTAPIESSQAVKREAGIPALVPRPTGREDRSQLDSPHVPLCRTRNTRYGTPLAVTLIPNTSGTHLRTSLDTGKPCHSHFFITSLDLLPLPVPMYEFHCAGSHRQLCETNLLVVVVECDGCLC